MTAPSTTSSLTRGVTRLTLAGYASGLTALLALALVYLYERLADCRGPVVPEPGKSRRWRLAGVGFFLLILAGVMAIAETAHVRTVVFRARQSASAIRAATRSRADDKRSASAVRDAVLAHWAAQPLPEPTLGMKVRGPCVLIARLALDQNVAEVNKFIQNLKPWSASGSEWDVREAFGWQKSYADKYRFGHRGDYDFTETGLVSLLYRFADKPELLHPETAEYIVQTLLIETGGRPRPRVPGSFGLVGETENHILMTESTRYLANQWRRAHGQSDPEFDNAANGLEKWLTGYLGNIRDRGFEEYNSNPYQGFALHAILNLEAFAAAPAVADLARQLLDAEAERYAFGSLSFRRCVPFRRRLESAALTDLSCDQLTAMMAVWAGNSGVTVPADIRPRAAKSSFGLIAAVLSYTLPEETCGLLDAETPHEYFVRFGRGKRASPEIYSAGPGFLLSAGGIAFAPLPLTQTVARPTTLLLADGETDLRQCFRLPGKGEAMTAWNNTGVAPRFACGNAPVLVPSRFKPVAQTGQWQVFRPLPDRDLLLVEYSRDGLGLLAVFPAPGQPPDALLRAAAQINPEAELKRRFVFPDDKRAIEYDVTARKGTWVIVADNGQPVERDCGAWPL